MISSSAKSSNHAGSSEDAIWRRLGRGVYQQALRWIVIAGIFVLWQAGTAFFRIPTFLFPAPTDIFNALWTNRLNIMGNMVPTIEEAATGFIIGNVVALLLATWFVHVRTARQALYPLAIVIQSIPLVALAPIFVVSLGTGFASKVAMTALISFFPTLVNATRGFEAVERPLIELFQSVNASRLDAFRKLRLPNALPYIFLGLRVTASASVIGAIIAEWIGADQGLGFMVINATYEFNAPLLWATLVASSALVLSAFALVALIERLVVPWEMSADAGSGGER